PNPRPVSWQRARPPYRPAASGVRFLSRCAGSDRASVALAMAELWPHLSRPEATAHARRMAGDLAEALRDPKAHSNELTRLAAALAAVCSQLDPADGQARFNTGVDIFLTRFQQRKNEDWTNALLTEPLVTLWVRLDRDGLARVADALFT